MIIPLFILFILFAISILLGVASAYYTVDAFKHFKEHNTLLFLLFTVWFAMLSAVSLFFAITIVFKMITL